MNKLLAKSTISICSLRMHAGLLNFVVYVDGAVYCRVHFEPLLIWLIEVN